MPSRVPARLTWAVDVLDAQPSERILEIGCGRGVAVELLAEIVTTGSVTGLDRSCAAISAAEARIRRHIRSGRVRLLNVSLADALLEERFDKIFAVNVNVFWLKPEKELAVIRNLLAPGGRLYLFYEPPSKAQGARAEAECRRNLTANGFEVEEVRWTDLVPHVGLCLIAAPAI